MLTFLYAKNLKVWAAKAVQNHGHRIWIALQNIMGMSFLAVSDGSFFKSNRSKSEVDFDCSTSLAHLMSAMMSDLGILQHPTCQRNLWEPKNLPCHHGLHPWKTLGGFRHTTLRLAWSHHCLLGSHLLQDPQILTLLALFRRRECRESRNIHGSMTSDLWWRKVWWGLISGGRVRSVRWPARNCHVVPVALVGCATG